VFGIDEQITTDTVLRREEVETKLELVRAWLDARGIPALVLAGVDSVAWLTAGLTNPIERGVAVSPLWLVVTSDDVAAVTTNVERPRLEAEAGLEELEIPLHEAPWFEPDGLARAAGELAGADRRSLACDCVPGFGSRCDDDLVELRLALLEPERARLTRLSEDATAALEDALRAWQPGQRDLDVQARVSERLERSGAHAVCLIVGGDDRVERFRHPLACGAPVTRLAMAVVVAERDGLHAAATRYGAAGPLTRDVRAARAAALSVEAEMLAASVPGATYGDVLRCCARSYEAAGHPDAWREHYQGGPIGYRQREFEIVPTQTDSRWFGTEIESGHAVAWNPSVAGGGKAEDTYLVSDDGVLRLTDTGAWPLEDGRPAVLDVTTGAAA
jgi:Xaa-Pro aminopeptidase